MRTEKMSSESRLEAVQTLLSIAYGVLEGVLLSVSLGIWWTTEIDKTATLVNIRLSIIVGVTVLSIVYILFNGLIITELFDMEDGARLAFVQTLITVIFAFCLAQAPRVFYVISLYWCGISPIGVLLSAGVSLVPYIRNKKATTIVGATSATIGFTSKFYSLPFVEEINILLMMAGALLTVIGVGSPIPKVTPIEEKVEEEKVEGG